MKLSIKPANTIKTPTRIKINHFNKYLSFNWKISFVLVKFVRELKYFAKTFVVHLVSRKLLKLRLRESILTYLNILYETALTIRNELIKFTQVFPIKNKKVPTVVNTTSPTFMVLVLDQRYDIPLIIHCPTSKFQML